MEYEFDLKKWNALLSKTRDILTKPDPEKPLFRRSRRAVQEQIRSKCHLHTSLTTALAHMPGAQPLLEEFLDEYKDRFFAGDAVHGLLTIRGMQTCKMLVPDDESEDEEAAAEAVEESTDSEREDSVYDEGGNVGSDD